jgi:hypothetical protein
MKITILQVLGAMSALNQLAGKPFPPVTSLKIARLASKLTPEAELAEKQRQKLIEESGAKLSKDGTVWEFPDQDAGKTYEAAWKEVVDSEINVHIDPLPLQALGETDVTPAVMQGLMPILFIEEEAAAKPEIVKKKQKAG